MIFGAVGVVEVVGFVVGAAGGGALLLAFGGVVAEEFLGDAGEAVAGAVELQLDVAGAAVAVFLDVEEGLAGELFAFLGVFGEALGPVQKGDDIGIVLDTAALAEVADLGDAGFVGAAVKLGQGEDGDV
jgi:hypothetical protein